MCQNPDDLGPCTLGPISFSGLQTNYNVQQVVGSFSKDCAGNFSSVTQGKQRGLPGVRKGAVTIQRLSPAGWHLVPTFSQWIPVTVGRPGIEQAEEPELEEYGLAESLVNVFPRNFHLLPSYHIVLSILLFFSIWPKVERFFLFAQQILLTVKFNKIGQVTSKKIKGRAKGWLEN